ncbi:MAG: ATP synthase F1 subunit epsilon [Bdellovibrionales bacterium CG12_big_fil_rev_8_21_14_0_65_38_15]|nr:MAG: ATP synthase F1 subunit epsilon [Bdellovibrionales bacterium CG22_combo_CG10-13_8_21_14_all_38_13]PIQ55951.1 MAG: ATP synthase F1 subunit epsilon [Bdellovibrionales bacterium CG12_big_fil_rev_8_21_14_0_65_38_15]PIR29571.1 MAG: ATP synthase F1 subunit epsilon [Bdellovibrionales bacterium CG11_big_fil_rev_8_21_14_0_20_38_13]
MKQFTVDVLTPSRAVARNIPAQALLIPTSRGQINVLPDHTHVVTQLSTGMLSIFGGADDPDRHFTVTHGICKVLEDKIVILSNTSEEQHEIDLDRATRALKFAEDKLANEALDEEDHLKFHRKAERAKLRIQFAKEQKNRK